jgi:stage V sporulation protein AA
MIVNDGGGASVGSNTERAPRLYLRLRKRIGIRPGQTVNLHQAARLSSSDPLLKERLGLLVLHEHKIKDGNRVVIDLMQIVQAIREAEPEVIIEPFGDPEVLVIVADTPRKPRFAVLAMTWLLLFFGSGLAIMNFHTDVSMKDVHIRITELVTGKRTEHPLWFQIPYSLGIGLGMLVFFNHLFRKRFNEEPNPLEVELYMYEENVNAYVIADEMRRKTDHTGRRPNNTDASHGTYTADKSEESQHDR